MHFWKINLIILALCKKNMVCGAATGAVFKSTLGVGSYCFWSCPCAGLAGAIHLLTEAGNKSGYIGFEMKF
jgi:import inner membrane translocase subunit TIM23